MLGKPAPSREQVVDSGTKWRKIAEAIFLLASFGSALFLLGPTLKMTFASSNGPIGPGSAPLVTLVLIMALAAWIALSIFFRAPKSACHSPDESEESSTGFVVTSACIFAGLFAFIYLWKLASFPVSAAILAALLSVALQPKSWRTLKRSLFSALVSTATVLAVWALFEFVLKIRLH